MIVNGQAIAGVNAIAGEWGYNPMPGFVKPGMVIPMVFAGQLAYSLPSTNQMQKLVLKKVE